MTQPILVPSDVQDLLITIEEHVNQAQQKMIDQLMALSDNPAHEPLLITIKEEPKS